MVNAVKYLSILESLELKSSISDSRKATQNDVERVTKNVNILRKYIKSEEGVLLAEQARELKLDDVPQLKPESKCAISSYCIYMQQLLLQLVNNINFNSSDKEDLISSRHLNLCIHAIQDLSYYALNQQLHPRLSIKSLHITNQGTTVKGTVDIANILLTLEIFAKVLLVKQFHVSNAMASVIQDYMGAIFTLFVAQNLKECSISDACLKQLQEKLDIIWLKITKTEYFRNILIFKGCRQLPGDVQKRLHLELLKKLSSPDGFTTLVATLVTASQHNESQYSTSTFEVIANIVAFKGHTQRFQHQMLQQVYNFIDLCFKHADSLVFDNMGAGLLALRKLYDLNAANQEHIQNWMRSFLEQLINPADLLSGLILMEDQEMSLIVSKLYHLFCTSIVECLPSNMLIPYMPLFLQLYESLPPEKLQRKQLSEIIIRCLANRSPEQLHSILGKLYHQKYDEDWHQLHERIFIQPNMNESTVILKIAPADKKVEFSLSLSLPELLLNGNHNILTYQVFISLLKHIDECLQNDADDGDIDLLQTQEDLLAYLNSKYPVKVELLLSLNTLVESDGLRNQLGENSADFLNLLKKFISERINVEASSSKKESADQTLHIMLTLTQEVLEYTQQPDQLFDLVPKLKILQEKTPNELVKQRIDCLLELLKGETAIPHVSNKRSIDGTLFNEARSLIESQESHLQVYGIQNLLKLLRVRDAVTLANTHVILALALTTLKNKESYTFLNCVRLFVALLDVMESEVLELLSDEYLNKQASMDQRLVVGEAILKVSKELGPISHKYKDVLLNCFMHGARSPNDEFRWSSYSNLSQLCRTLSYQVHNFFYELINLIDSELSTGSYLPAKRAAVLVISELLEGMENLIDFEEMLLPVYRLLKAIEANDSCDEKMRIHAMNGLKALTEKCKKFLFPDQILQKPIKIVGIKEENTKTNIKILELN